MDRRKKPVGHHSRHRTVGRIIAIIVSYAVLFCGAKLVCDRLTPAANNPNGDLSSRLAAETITLDYGGKTWVYRHSLTNVLLVGLDWQEDAPVGTDAATAAEETDGQEAEAAAPPASSCGFLTLLTVDRQHKTVYTLPLDPNTLAPAELEGQGRLTLAATYDQAQMEAGQQLANAVSRLLCGVPLDAYVLLDQDAIPLLNNVLGGLSVTVADDLTAVDPAFAAGATLTLSDEQARHYICTPLPGPAARTQRQQDFMHQAMSVFFDRSLQDIEFAAKVYDALSGHLHSDVDRRWMADRMSILYQDRKYEHLGLSALPGAGAASGGGWQLNEDELYKFLTARYFE